MLRVLSTETAAQFASAVEEAARLLEQGEVVAVPTETVYGLAANALNPEAVKKIFAIKGRPTNNPLIVHVASVEMAREYVAGWSHKATALTAKHWPGPLTLVLPKAAIIPNEVTADGPTVAVRWPSHPFMQALIRRCGFPLAAPSANRSNEISPTNAQHVIASLGEKIPLLIDGGQCQVGIESTVFDIENDRVLRPGTIPSAALESSATRAETNYGKLRSPGLMQKHYAPRARLVVAGWRDTEEAARIATESKGRLETTRVIAYNRIPTEGGFAAVAVIPEDAEAYARALYAELHRCDEAQAELILVETPPEGPMWEGIRDRLRRATTR